MDLLDYSDEIYLDRNEYGNDIYYKDKYDNFYDIYGKRIECPVKFETLFNDTIKQQVKNKKNNMSNTSNMNNDIMKTTYGFTSEVMDLFLDHFEGKEVGSDDCNKEVIMKFFFEDYTPNKKGKKKKTGKKNNSKLSGYTLFGKEMKDKINEKKKKKEDNGEKPKYVEVQSKMWKKLSEDEKSEWNKKSKVMNKEAKEADYE